MPRRAWVGVSPFAIWSTMGITSSIGIAKPRPIDPDCADVCELAVRIEELIPTTAPVMSVSGPPELPGLIAASVWIAGYVVELPWSSEPTLTGRSSALTMPLVTVASRPKGEPMATTPSPTPRLADLPMVAGVRPETSCAWITAVSVSGSVPRISASALVPSEKSTLIVPPSPATSTTWLLVRIVPSSVRMMPEPDPDSPLPVTSILTTLGSTFWATDSTEPSAGGVCVWLATVEVTGASARAEPAGSSWVASHTAAPPSPAPPPTRSEVATTAAARPVRRRRGGSGR